MDDFAILAERFAQLALAVAYFAGVILAVVFWSRQPRPALLLFLAAGMLLAVELVFIATWMVPDDRFDGDNFFSILNAIDSSVRLLAFVLLMLAIFSDRNRRRPLHRDFDDDAP